MSCDSVWYSRHHRHRHRRPQNSDQQKLPYRNINGYFPVTDMFFLYKNHVCSCVRCYGDIRAVEEIHLVCSYM